MKVTVDVNVMLHKLTAYNPDIDLIGLKAYLFDLMLGDGGMGTIASGGGNGKTKEIVYGDVEQAASEPSPFPPAKEIKTESFEEDEESIPPGLIGAESPAGDRKSETLSQTIIRGKGSAQERLEARKEKRKAIEDYSKLSSKEIMERIANQHTPKKKSGQNQFVDMGSDTGGGSDIEIG